MRSKEYFNCSDLERATFEAGIKLASLYHQFIGAPVNMDSVEHFEDTMEKGMMAQPYVKSAKVWVDKEVLHSSLTSYGYCSLNERMLNARVSIEYEGYQVDAELGWVDELSYPLMRISRIEEVQ